MPWARAAPRTVEYPVNDHPPMVTGLTPDPRVPGSVVVELDGSRFGSVPRDAICADEVREGSVLDSPVFQRLADAADMAAAYRVALRILAARPRSVFEMRRGLRDRGHGQAAIDQAVERLLDCSLLDDQEYARTFVRVRAAKGHGPSRLLADLRSRGVEGRLAEQTVGLVLEDEGVDLDAQMKRLAEKRLSQLHGLPSNTRRRRVLAFLGRRGYTGWTVREAVEQLLAEA